MSPQHAPIRWICSTRQAPWRAKALRPVSTAADLTITGECHQTMAGFGGCFNELGWIELCRLSAGARQAVLRALFDPETGCGFNLCRLPIGASDYAADWYSLNETPGDLAMRHFSIARDKQRLIPYIQAALAIRPDMKLFASPWSPPTWMKRPAVYNYGTLIWDRKILEAYALYFARFVQAYSKAGIRIHQIHHQNEPVANQKFPSCIWTGDQMRVFIRDYLGPAFRKHKVPSEIWLGTLNVDEYDGFIQVVLRDPVARAYLGGVSLQYAGSLAIQRLHQAWPALALMQSEHESGPGTVDNRNTWSYAGHAFNLMRHYIVNGAGAYIYWNMVLAEDGMSTWGWPQNSMVTVNPRTQKVTYTPEFYLMKHFSRFIAPGARRVELAGPWTGNALAFQNPDGHYIAVVRNPFAKAAPLAINHKSRTWSALLPPDSFNTVCVAGI